MHPLEARGSQEGKAQKDRRPLTGAPGTRPSGLRTSYYELCNRPSCEEQSQSQAAQLVHRRGPAGHTTLGVCLQTGACCTGRGLCYNGRLYTDGCLHTGITYDSIRGAPGKSSTTHTFVRCFIALKYIPRVQYSLLRQGEETPQKFTYTLVTSSGKECTIDSRRINSIGRTLYYDTRADGRST